MTPPEVTVSLTVRWTPRESGSGTLPDVVAAMTEAMESLPAKIGSATLDIFLGQDKAQEAGL